ncbi:disease resistance protein RGA2-like [Syzygium oleosum]|uniref:disease resistance protein RGA2-like n=1 Tax=Syzygium oleosum TaxID=219896 RepID=UPI0024B9AA53|nr:disease resistance protein RGA2-like [Syzygium oleosum]
MPCGLRQLSSLHRLTRFILPQKNALAKNYCRLGELNELNNIRGSLSIENLGHITDAKTESRVANLIEKHSLDSLALQWGNFDTDDAVIGNRDEALLDGLRPHSNLQKLTINGYNGESFPRWMMGSLVSSLPNLVGLRLWNCGRCKHLPQFGPSKLKRLEITEMKFLEYLPEECWKSLSSLEFLRIKYCPRLTSLSLGMQHLSNLVDLSIRSCEELDLSKDKTGKILDFQGLKSLRSVEIIHLPKLASLPQWLLQLSNLERLEISSCVNLKALPEHMKALQSLQRLRIFRCEGLQSLVT